MSDDLAVYERQGFRQQLGFGRRPALLIIDFINGFKDPEKFGGGNIQAAIDATVPLLAAARRLGLPVAFTRHVYAADGSDRGIFNMKVPALDGLTPDSSDIEVVDELTPESGERVVDKRYPSGFFATDLAAWLIARGADTAIVAGCTTSGCLRATVVDAMCHGFRPIVPRECAGDRALGPHEANLFDLEQKYADVLPLAEVLDELERLDRRNEA